MSFEWRLRAQCDAGTDDDPAKPNWGAIHQGDELIPFCSEKCPHFDGKRCRVMGFKPSSLCGPVVAQMAKLLSQSSDS